MKVLVIGAGGREHALAWKLDQSDQVDQVFVAPGNAGTAASFNNVDLEVMDIDGLVDFAKQEDIDLVVVGPEDPLSAGIVDRFQAEGIKIFGPSKACARFEASKDFTKQFLNRYDIPTARSYTTSDYKDALSFVGEADLPLVVKADGLCQGKGVIICQTRSEAEDALADLMMDQTFGPEGSTVVIEEFLEGIEQSLLCFVSNNRLIPMETAQDYKKIGVGDLGPNTGGVGVYSPSKLVNPELSDHVAEILLKIENGLKNEEFEFYGILFIGFMIKDNQAKVLEFNTRFGDPETEALMPRLESDLLAVILSCLDGSLTPEDLVWAPEATVGVILFSEGYPGKYESGVAIDSLPEDLGPGEIIFHNGTGRDAEGGLVTQGGRVLTAIGMAEDLPTARSKAYHLVKQISGQTLNYRTDIAEF